MADCLYTRQLADEICRRISEGESLRSICRDPGFPSEGSVRAWSREDRDGFAVRFRIARDLQLDCWSAPGGSDWMLGVLIARRLGRPPPRSLPPQ
jgi:hypothetical protein